MTVAMVAAVGPSPADQQRLYSQRRLGLDFECGGGHLPAGEVVSAGVALPRSVLIMRAKAPRAALEPVTPQLRSARRDTGLPAAVSLRATMRA